MGGSNHHEEAVLADLRAGFAQHQAGQFDRAEAAYRKALRRNPEHPGALHLLGLLASARGQQAEAVRLIGQALRVMPELAPAHMDLGNAHNALGQLDAAEASYRRAIALDPMLAAAHVNLAMLLNDRGAHEEAAESCRRAIAVAPGLMEAQLVLAGALRAQRNWAEAEPAYRRAVALRPERPETLSDLATMLGEMGRFNEALDRHRRALTLRPGSPVLLRALASTLRLQGDLAGAEAAFGQALALAPLDLASWFGRGHCLAGLGRFDEARACLRRVVDADAENSEAPWEAQWLLAQIGALPEDATTEDRLRDLLARAEAPPMRRVFAGFALGQMLDAQARYDDAFASVAQANALFRALREAAGERVSVADFAAGIDQLIAATPADIFGAIREWGVASEQPVFVVGMPRSGITVVEQIAASHSEVHGAGGLARIAQINLLLASENQGRATLAEWDAGTSRKAAEDHLAGLATLGGGAARVIDATPDNVLMLGLIAALFPGARVVLCTRDARDLCLSNFFQFFAEGNLFSRDLVDCARRLREMERLVAHWRAVLPIPMLELRYESLVADPEGESRRLIEFLGLPWDPACLAFHRTQRKVTTPAMWQVRQPIFSHRVGRWRHYEPHLGPLLAALE